MTDLKPTSSNRPFYDIFTPSIASGTEVRIQLHELRCTVQHGHDLHPMRSDDGEEAEDDPRRVSVAPSVRWFSVAPVQEPSRRSQARTPGHLAREHERAHPRVVGHVVRGTGRLVPYQAAFRSPHSWETISSPGAISSSPSIVSPRKTVMP